MSFVTQACFSKYRKEAVAQQKPGINKEKNTGAVITGHVEKGFQTRLFKIKNR